MAGDYSAKLILLNNYNSYAELARRYEIPYRTLLSIKNTGNVPADYTKNLRKLWSTESYSAMRYEGVPTLQRSALRGGTISKVLNVIDTTNKLLDSWATGASKLKFGVKSFNILDSVMLEFYSNTRERIKNSLSNNKTTVEGLYEGEQTRY